MCINYTNDTICGLANFKSKTHAITNYKNVGNGSSGNALLDISTNVSFLSCLGEDDGFGRGSEGDTGVRDGDVFKVLRSPNFTTCPSLPIPRCTPSLVKST